MKKILIISLILLSIAFVLIGAGVTGSSPSTTYKRLSFLSSDSLTTSLSKVEGGNGTYFPYGLSINGFYLESSNKLYLNGTNNYIFGSSTHNVHITASDSLTLTFDKLKFSSGGDIDASDNLSLTGNVNCVGLTAKGTATVPTVACTTFGATGTSTITDADIATLDVTGTTTLATANLEGTSTIIDADVTVLDVSGITTLAVTNISGATHITASDIGLDVDNNVNIDGTLTVDLTSTLTGKVTCGDELATNTISEKTAGTGVTVAGLLLKDRDIFLNGAENFIAFDADDDTYLYNYDSLDDNIYVHIGGNNDFSFTANTFSALSGSKFTVNTIAETSSNVGVTLEGCAFERKAAFYSVLAPSGTYIGIVDSDVETDPSTWASTNKDLYVEGIFEVDGSVYLDSSLTVAGTTTLGSIYLSSDDDIAIRPNGQGADDLSIRGGDGEATGGNLYLDGGNATADGDVILGDAYGNVSINSNVLYPEYNTIPCTGSAITDNAREVTSYLNVTVATAITLADGVEGQIKKYVTIINGGTYDVTITATRKGYTQTLILNDTDECCELIFHAGFWYISSLSN